MTSVPEEPQDVPVSAQRGEPVDGVSDSGVVPGSEASGKGDEGLSPDLLGPRGLLDLAAAKNKTGVFALMTCGFLVSLCCLGGTCGVSGFALVRMGNLADVRESIGVPGGWEAVDTTSFPWRATAELEGPVDAAVVEEWLVSVGARAKDAGCVMDGSCTVGFVYDDYDVSVEYSEAGSNASAVISVG